MDVLALIPARSGSKGIPHKNIANFRGKPLLAHSVIQAAAAQRITRVIISTDSELYASIARQYGAEAPFLRPKEISGDGATDLQVFEHALQWLAQQEGYCPDICVHLRPTCPIRRVADINAAVDALISDSSFDSVRTVVKAPETPWKMWFMDEEGILQPVITSGLREPYNLPRQLLPPAYLQNACVDVVWAKVILEQHSMTGRRIRGMVMEELHDIDDPGQFQSACLAANGPMTGKRLVIDIDGVIATLVPHHQYDLAEPIEHAIQLVNRLYDDGNAIILFTARGSATGVDWARITLQQLKRWGVRYHELRFGKPAADYYIDDHNLSLSDLEKILKCSQGLWPSRPKAGLGAAMCPSPLPQEDAEKAQDKRDR